MDGGKQKMYIISLILVKYNIDEGSGSMEDKPWETPKYKILDFTNSQKWI